MTIRTQRRRDTRTGRLEPIEESPYKPNGTHSFFRDLARVASFERRKSEMIARSGSRMEPDPQLPSVLDRGRGGETLADARHRLELAAWEARALSWTDGQGGEFAPINGVPGYIASAFAIAAHARAAVVAAIGTEPLPQAGQHVQIPILTGAASVGIQVNEADAVSSTDATTGLADDKIATIAGGLTISQQLLDRSSPGFDEVLAAELGAAWAEHLESQVLNGSGSSGQLLGLLNVSGVTSVTYTDATPTPAKVLAAMGELASNSADALGRPLRYLAMAPRRELEISTKLGAYFEWPGEVVTTTAMPQTLGAGTNEDRVIAFEPDELRLYVERPSFVVHEQVLDNTLQVRIRAYGYAAAVFDRKPLAIGVLGGTGLAAFSW